MGVFRQMDGCGHQGETKRKRELFVSSEGREGFGVTSADINWV